MAKRVKQLKGYIIKETTKGDNTSYSHWITKDGEIVWECDSLAEAEEWIG